MANGTASVAVDRDIDDRGVHLAADRGSCWVLNPITDVGTQTAANERAIHSFIIYYKRLLLPSCFECRIRYFNREQRERVRLFFL